MGDQDRIKFARSGILRPGDGKSGIVKQAGAVEILKHHGPVQDTKLSIHAAKGVILTTAADTAWVAD